MSKTKLRKGYAWHVTSTGLRYQAPTKPKPEVFKPEYGKAKHPRSGTQRRRTDTSWWPSTKCRGPSYW